MTQAWRIRWVRDNDWLGVTDDNRAMLVSTGPGDGLSPSDHLLMAVGASVGGDLNDLLSEMGLKYEKIDVNVSGKVKENEDSFGEIDVQVDVDTGIFGGIQYIKKMTNVIMDRMCPVINTLKGGVSIRHTASIVESK